MGSLKGLAIAISLCDSETHVIFLFFTILTMLWCFPGLVLVVVVEVVVVVLLLLLVLVVVAHWWWWWWRSVVAQ